MSIKDLNQYESFFDSKELQKLPISQVVEIKQKIELKLNNLINYLSIDLKSNLQDSLLTQDGFPKNDNIVDIRFTRVAIIKYKNDLEEIIDAIS